MNRKLLVVIGAIAAVFIIAVVGASSLNLTGSDSAPGEGKTDAACAKNLVVKTPIDTSVHDSNEIKQMDITGDMSGCVGQTLRAEVDLESGDHVWAVYKITSSMNAITLEFNASTGDFRDSKPIAANGELTAQGNRVAPVLAKDFGLTTVTIAKTWQ
jgi:hypothetical protein